MDNKNKDFELPLIRKEDPLPLLPNKRFQKVKSKFAYYNYLDIFPFIKSINSNPHLLQYQDTPLPFDSFNIGEKISAIAQERFNHNSFSKTCVTVHKKEFLGSLVIVFLLVNSHILSSFILGKIMDTVTMINLDLDTDRDTTILYALAFAIINILTNLLENWWSYFTYTLGASLRLSITGFMYAKLNKVALSALNELNIGKIINIFANDVNDLDSGPTFVAPMLLAPYSLILCCYLLWTYFGIHSFISVVILAGCMVFAMYLSNRSEEPRKARNLITDQRIKYTTEFIENIRLIKLYAWEKPLRQAISKVRDQEVVLLKKLGDIDSIARVFTESSSYVAILLMSVGYVYSGGILTPEKMYTSFMILSIGKFWVIFTFHLGRMFLVEAKLTGARIEEVLAVVEEDGALKKKNQKSMIGSNGMVEFRDFTGFWSQNSEKPCLKGLNLTIKPEEFIAVIGKIGSGKTSFLLSFLNEIPKTQGSLHFNGSLAYVEQEPVIFSGSIRENISFGIPFEESLYTRVLRACNLDEDLEQLDHGDQTLVGERGVTLSGGQKVRLSLARALYAQRDIYLLDDPLSAVDSRVGRLIFERAIKGMLREKIAILVTHHLNYAKEADRVVVMKDGEIEAEGKWEELGVIETEIFGKSEEKSERILEEKEVRIHEEKQNMEEEESTTVTKETYLAYLRESGSFLIPGVVLVMYCLNYVFVIAFTKHIGSWAQAHNEAYYQNRNAEFEHWGYISMSFFYLALIFIFVFVKATMTIRFLLDTDTKLHEKMLYKISRTFVAFFDSTPIGTILNRFSNDLGILDKNNWPVVYDFLDLASSLLLYMSYLCIINFWIAIPCILMIFSLYKIKVYFTRPSIQIKRLELMSRSPIFSEISSTINGLLIIRVYNQSARFVKKFSEILYRNSRVFIAYARITRAFSTSLQICLYSMCLFGISFFIYIAYFSTIPAGIFGLALYYLITISGDSVWAIRQTIFLDIHMQSAQRIGEYCLLAEEPPCEIPSIDNRLKNFPFEGVIEFKNVYLRYPKSQNYALNGLSLKIEPRTKIAIVGRTGAGKSSIIQALFRIFPIEKRAGSFIKIDGVDINTMGLEKLRESLSILPQSPVIFAGTIRRNLDPFREATEERLWEVLEQVNLKNYVENLEKGLETDMSIGNSVFSVGQKQLICLARVILRKSKVVILDEATANVDVETDRFIQEQIERLFKDYVVVTIAHRLSTVASYDKVMVLEKGVMVEFGHPYKLLVEKVGVFAEMVKKMGEKIEKDIFEIAKRNYMKKNGDFNVK